MIESDIQLIQINNYNMAVFTNLAQAYEAEFSSLTQKLPDSSGLFKIDTIPKDKHIGYLLYFKKLPVGFCVLETKSNINDISEFYIVPAMRKKNLGYQLAVKVFSKHPGIWQVRQIIGATEATNFWRIVINKYTDGQYVEDIVQDHDWGLVTRQKFNN